jgi:hypothetical protein
MTIDEPITGSQVKRLLYVLMVTVLTMLYLKLIYPSGAIDAGRRGSMGQKAYLFLVKLFGIDHAGQGGTLMLAVYAMFALLAAVVTVWLLARLFMRPRCVQRLVRQR